LRIQSFDPGDTRDGVGLQRCGLEVRTRARFKEGSDLPGHLTSLCCRRGEDLLNVEADDEVTTDLAAIKLSSNGFGQLLHGTPRLERRLVDRPHNLDADVKPLLVNEIRVGGFTHRVKRHGACATGHTFDRCAFVGATWIGARVGHKGQSTNTRALPQNKP
jgi:hypothetical protein